LPASKRGDSSMFGDGEILLVFPGKYRASNPQVPLAMLHVAYPLVHEGYKVRILDMRVDDYRTFKLGNPVFVGISSMSGLQIRYGLEFAQKVRTDLPSCPIVWGGVHPSLLPEQTAASPFVDIVVRGEAEPVIAELANYFSTGIPLDDVAGITYKFAGKIRSNPESQPIDLDSIPIELPFDLLRLDAYPSLKSGRFHIQTSRGCPHRCGYCYNLFFNKRGWRGKSAERVLDEIEHVLEKYPTVKIIDPIDDNFFVDKKRVEDICRGLIERKINVAWRANCRFDYFSNYSREFISLMEKSGCTELDFGGETGSERLLTLICKEMTPAQMVKSVEKLKNWAPSIKPYVTWMSGLPTETDEDLKKTMDLMDRMSEANHNTQHVGVFVYTPFPSPLVEDLGQELTTPQSLEGWGNIDMFHFKPPWHTKKYVEKLHTISAVTRYAFYPEDRIRERSILYKLGYGILNKMAKFRWKKRYFGLPVELQLTDAVARKARGWL
jgi:anaerobic magnesium-protoporphyrin IX monomethyl ester cyclase